MKENETIGELTAKIERASTDFEKTNTELKRKYLIWNIEAFNIIASKIDISRGSFGTGYPFYALDENLEGKLPIIEEQIRYNRKLVKDGIPVQKSIWLCESCLKKNYSEMPDLKKVCKPCPNMLDKLKPRKIINRLPDLDMWLVCEDGTLERAQELLGSLLEMQHIHTTDVNPITSFDDVIQISAMIKNGQTPDIFLPIDAHIIEYSNLLQLIEQIPLTIKDARKNKMVPYLPIHPKSYRKMWQYDDEAYNFVFDFLFSFTPFNFPKELQENVDKSRLEVAKTYKPEELFSILMEAATPSVFRRLQTKELENLFLEKMKKWRLINCKGNIAQGEDGELEL